MPFKIEGKATQQSPSGDGQTGHSSGVPPSVNLPKGGGAIRGIGEKFSFDSVTGTGKISIPIPTAKTRGNLNLSLALTYDSGSGNGPFGLGWQLSLASITRKTDKGLPKYTDHKPADVFVFAGAEDLVPVREESSSDGYLIRTFRPRIENDFSRIEWWFHPEALGRSHWRVLTNENITHVFGFSSSARIADPLNPSHIFQWLLELSFDDAGNSILYRYCPEDLTNVKSSSLSESHRLERRSLIAGTYIESVLYGNRRPFTPEKDDRYWDNIGDLIQNATDLRKHWLFRIFFDYSKRNEQADPSMDNTNWFVRADAFSSYRSGFEIRTYRLCQRILFENHISIEIDGQEKGYVGITHGLILSYSTRALDESAQNNIDIFSKSFEVLSKLRSIQQINFRRTSDYQIDYETAVWPPLELAYSEAAPMVLNQIPQGDAPGFKVGIDGAQFEWLDLDAEGIPGVLSRTSDAWWYSPNRWALNISDQGRDPNQTIRGGAFRLPFPLVRQPAGASLGHALQLIDLEGDGFLDVLDHSSNSALVCERTDTQDWSPARTLPRNPALDLLDPNVRLIDLDGDGLSEILLTEDDCFVWQENLGTEGFGAIHRIAKNLDEKQGPRCVFNEVQQTIFIADMSGDGLMDIVRIRNGEVSYWPNLGYGRFGARVAMENAPVFDSPNLYDPKRLRLLDADGSGTTDIIYLGHSGASYWANSAGNQWSNQRELPFRLPHNHATITSTDFYGRGTNCLVWSSDLPADTGDHFLVVDLTGGIKPHLLIHYQNNLGAETTLSYRSSTEFYLADLANGKPWLTRLPFPVHVIEKVETRDIISRNLFVSRYAYHHGYFDGFEREFRGFGMVEQWDTEVIGSLSSYQKEHDNWENESYVPPKLTKTWFHHGAYLLGESVFQAFKREYWTDDENGIDLPDTTLPLGLSSEETREAVRALRGRILRQEVYALDASHDSPSSLKARAARPYEVVEHSYTLKLLQPKGENLHAIFFVHNRESAHAHYERLDPPDPRVTHELTLKVDDWGNVEQALSVAYGRRKMEFGSYVADERNPSPEEQAIQHRTLIALKVSSFTNAVDHVPHVWRAPNVAETREYELTDGEWVKSHWLNFKTMEEAISHLDEIPEIAYTTLSTYSIRQRRLIEHIRTQYRSDNFKTILPLGRLETLGIPGTTLKLALTEDFADVYDDKLDRERLVEHLRNSESGYVEPDGDGCFWIPTGRIYFSPDATGTPQGASAELAFAKSHFFLPHRYVDTFGNVTLSGYDDHNLQVVSIIDALGNLTQAEYDYRLLLPRHITDANNNHGIAAFDLRGMVVGTAVLGKIYPKGAYGDTLEGFNADLTSKQLADFYSDPALAGPELIGSATTRYVYDLLRYFDAPSGKKAINPVFAATLERQFHVDLPFEADSSERRHAGIDNYKLKDRIHCRFSYSDGVGREIQQKVRTTPQISSSDPTAFGPRRWIGSGWTIYNNKGQPVRKYEPFFTEESEYNRLPHAFEYRRLQGVSPIIFYDPMGRQVGTLHSDHSWEKIVFSPWWQTSWDRNDTVLIDPLGDDDVGAYFARLSSLEWPLLEGGSPTWYRQRSLPTELERLFPGTGSSAVWRRNQEAASASKASDHAATPTLTYFDTLGRAYLVITHNRFVDPRSLNPKEEFAHTWTQYDIEGNQRAVVDALGRAAAQWQYDMLGRALHEDSIDAGSRWHLPDAGNQKLYEWDERGQTFRYRYDGLRRLSESWLSRPGDALADGSDREICFERLIYGDYPEAPTEGNLRGRLWRHHDTAGLMTHQRYDAKGNLRIAVRRFCNDYKTVPNWASEPRLEDEEFLTTTEYDALNRPIQVVSPDGFNGERGSQTFHHYNLAGQIFAETVFTQTPKYTMGVSMGFKWEPFNIIRGIDYNARGQRRVVQYGNNEGGYGLRTTSSYDQQSFRLLNQETIGKNQKTPTNCYQALSYAYDPVGNITAIRDSSQENLFFNNQVVRPDSDYNYDALYRLTAAFGREHTGQNLPPNAWDTQRRGSFNNKCAFMPFANPNDPQAMRNYTQRYVYDQVGNFEEVIHQAGTRGSWSRKYSYEQTLGLRGKRSNRLVSTSVGGLKEQYGYDVHGSMVAMPHLQRMETDFRDQLYCTKRQSVDCSEDRPSSQGEQTYYVYDANGERLRKVTERNGQRIQERRYLGSAETYREFKVGSEEIVLERLTLHVTDAERCFALFETRSQGDDDTEKQLIRSQFANHLGSACLEVQFDPKAPIISYEEFHPYGTTAYQAMHKSIKAAAKRYRFTGKERDEESGLNYHSARYLATWLGRWISADPSGMKDGPNRFVYAKQNPIGYTDPSGHISKGQVTGFVAAVAVGVAITMATGGMGAPVVLAAAIGGGSISNIAATTVEAMVDHRALTLKDIGISAAIGAGAALGGAALGKLASVAAKSAPVKVAANSVIDSSLGKAFSSGTKRLASTIERTNNRLSEFVGKLTSGARTELNSLSKANKTISSEIAETIKLSEVATIDTAEVRFTQDSVKSTFRNNGMSINDAAKALREGGSEVASNFPPIRLVEHEGQLFSLDNRRLLTFSLADQKVPYRMATDVEIAKEWVGKFTTTQTQGWGQFIKVRQ